MQKKKSPILLLSIVGVIACILVIGNITGILFRPPMDGPDPLKEAPVAPPKEVTKADKDRTLAQLKKASERQLHVGKMDPEGGPEGAQGNPALPSIIIPDQQAYKPTYNETSTSGHWYDKNSNEEKRGEELASKRNR